MAGNPRFKEPPVREVALTVFFDRIPTLQTINLARLRVNWMETYPNVNEVPPRPPFRGERSYAEFLGSNSSWPMPFTTFSDDFGDHVIQLQADRFGIVWSFAKYRRGYPGYERLSQELFSRFEEFQAEVSRELGIDTTVTDIDLEYTNEVENYSPEQLALGILTGWRDVPLTVNQADLAGLCLHYCDDLDIGDGALTISVETPSGTDRTDTCSLELNVTARVTDQRDVHLSMESAHDLLVNRFVSLLNDDLRRQWGLYDD